MDLADRLRRFPWGKALDQWLDGADDRVTRAAFVVGEPDAGAGALVRALGAATQAWGLPAGSLAHDGDRLRSPAAVDALLRLLPADVVVIEAVADTAALDRLLSLHQGSRAVWLYRPWQDAAARAKSAPDAADAALAGAIVRDEPLDPPLPEGLRERLRAALPSAPGPALAAVAAWCARVGGLVAHGWQDDPRVKVVSTADLAADPEGTLAGIAAFLGLTAPPAVAVEVPVAGPAPEIAPAVASLAEALDRKVRVTLPREAPR
jgi:hypothetical protein